MKKSHMSQNSLLIIAFLLILVGVCGVFIYKSSSNKGGTVQEKPITDLTGTMPSQSEEITGSFECLPAKDPSAIITMQCINSIKTQQGQYYILDLNSFTASTPNLPPFEVGDMVIAKGMVTPVAALSTNQWEAYNLTGVISVRQSLTINGTEYMSTTASEEAGKWQEFSHPQQPITLSYPKTATLQQSSSGAFSITRQGATQTTGTELFDGYTLSFDHGEFTQASFEAFVKSQHQEKITTDAMGDAKNVTEVTDTEVAGFKAQQFTVSGMGEFNHLYLLIEGKTYLHITRIVVDPQQVGFEGEVLQILDTIKKK